MAPRVLLSSVFKPFSVDSIYSRRESKIELLHNQITKAQGPFSLRNFHMSYGLHIIANNIEVPTTVLEFPTIERFKAEVRKGYDIVGISSILPNFQKLKLMVDETRNISPRSTIVVGGFCTPLPGLDKMIEVDHVCVGEGISFMRNLLDLPEHYDYKNPDTFSENRELLGVPIIFSKTPQIIVGLGCSYGCDFCCPSHFFGKKHIKFFKTGRDLFNEMVRMEKKFHSNYMGFAGDDNFLLDLERAEELRKCIVESGRVYKSFIFASADRTKKFGPERLAEMGVSSIWIGREGKFADHAKNRNLDISELVAELRSYGIKTILSSILLLDKHTKENIMEDIEDHLSCRPAFSQFAYYGPLPGTPLYERMARDKKILTSIPFEEWHGFKQPWFLHPEFNLTEAEKIQNEAYTRDFLELGPSVVRLIETEYEGWLNLKDSPKPHLRARAKSFAHNMRLYKILLLASLHLAPSEKARDLTKSILDKVEGSFGKAGPIEIAAARGLHITGSLRKFRTTHWGDAIQPRTRVIKYN